jgi:O-antigen ligase
MTISTSIVRSSDFELDKAVYLLPLLIGGVVIGAAIQPMFGVAAFGLTFTAICCVSPFAILLSLIWLLPISPYVPLPLPIHDLFALVRFLLFLVILTRRVAFHEPIKQWLLGSRISKALLLYTFVAALSLFVFNKPLSASLAGAAFMRWISYLCGYYSLIALVTSENRSILVLRTLLVSTLAAILFACYQLAIRDYSSFWHFLFPPTAEGVTIEPWNGRLTSTFIHFNSFAAYLNLVIPFALGLWLFQNDKRLKRLGRWTVILSVGALVLTQSRGGMAGFTAIVIVCLWAKSESRLVFAKRVFSLAALGSLAVFIIGRLLERFAIIDEAGLSRVVVWGAALTLFGSAPWIGVGFGNFRELYGDLIPGYAKVLDAHNLYLQLLSETGIIGFVAFFVLVVIVIRAASRNTRLTGIPGVIGIGALGMVWGVLAHGTVDYVVNVCPPFSALFFFILGLLAVDRNTENNSLPYEAEHV